MRGVRVIARGITPKPDHLAETGALADAERGPARHPRRAYWGDGFVDTPVYDGTRLGEGATVDGPALDRGAVHGRGAAPGHRPRRSTVSATTSSRCDARDPARLPLPLGPGVVPVVRGVPRPARRRGRRGARSGRGRSRDSASCSTARPSCSRTTSRCDPIGASELVAGLHAGRLAAGPWYVQPDSLLPGGRDPRPQPAAGARGGGRARSGLDGRVRPRLVRPSRAVPAALRGLRPRPVRLLAGQRRRARHARAALHVARTRRHDRARVAAPRGVLLRGRARRRRGSRDARSAACGPSSTASSQAGADPVLLDERLRPSPGRHVDRGRRRAPRRDSACSSTTPPNACRPRRRSPSSPGRSSARARRTCCRACGRRACR